MRGGVEKRARNGRNAARADRIIEHVQFSQRSEYCRGFDSLLMLLPLVPLIVLVTHSAVLVIAIHDIGSAQAAADNGASERRRANVSNAIVPNHECAQRVIHAQCGGQCHCATVAHLKGDGS